MCLEKIFLNTLEHATIGVWLSSFDKVFGKT